MTFKRLKRPVLSIILVLCLALIIAQPAQAQGGIPPSDDVPAGQTIEGDMLLVGQNVTVDGNITGDLFAFGGSVTVNGEIGGSLYTIAETITTNGEIGGSTYQGALELNFGARTHVGRNAYLLGLDITTENGSFIGNDLFAAGLQGWFGGEIARYLKSVVVILNVEGQIGVGPEEMEESPESEGGDGGSTGQGGVISLIRLEMPVDEYIQSQRPAMLDEWIIVEESRFAAESSNPTLEWFLDYFRKLITVLVFGALAIWLFPAKLKAWSKQVRSAPLSAGLWGLVVLIFAGLVSLIAALLIPAMVVILWRITFFGLASVVLSLGYTSLGFAVILFILAAAYISKVIVAYIIGDLILGRVRPNTHAFWALLLGAVIFIALWLIPLVGWIFGFLAALVGLGSIWLVYRGADEPSSETESEGDGDVAEDPPNDGEAGEDVGEEGVEDEEVEDETAEAEEDEPPDGNDAEEPSENDEPDSDAEAEEPSS
jgi:hypothetical protein